MRYFWITVAIVFYSAFWFACVCMIFGLLLPNPVRFGKSISGANKGSKSYKKRTGSSIDKDDYLFYETIDD